MTSVQRELDYEVKTDHLFIRYSDTSDLVLSAEYVAPDGMIVVPTERGEIGRIETWSVATLAPYRASSLIDERLKEAIVWCASMRDRFIALGIYSVQLRLGRPGRRRQ